MPHLQQHLNTLGFDTQTQYKLWCYRHGLDTSLQKTPAQLQKERDLFKSHNTPSDTHVRHNPILANLIKRIFNGACEHENLSIIPARMRTVYNTLNDQPDVQNALKRLILHVEKYADLLRPTLAKKQYGKSIENSYLGGLVQLARHHKDWIHPVEDWRPIKHKPRLQFNHLSRHLLAKYFVPSFFDSAFFMGNTKEAHAQQNWFKHIGQGQNIRTAGVPMRITKRMAHTLTQPKFDDHRLTLNQALRMAQYNTLRTGAQTWHTSWIISHGPLGEKIENDDFWETVVQFVGNQNFLDRDYINPIIDYIRHQKYEPQRLPQPDGHVIEGPPPHPNFCMKGRSANKLLRLVDEWHQELTGLEDVELEKWASSGFNEFEHTAQDTKLNRNVRWSVHELVTSQQLYAEGRIMRHCVGSYIRRCITGEKSVWSLRALDLDAARENQVEEHVLTIEVDNKKKTIVQFAGKCNLKPFGKKALARQRHADSVYLHLLNQSPTFMRMWMAREGLSG